MTQPTSPNVTDYTTFIRNVMGISGAYLPDGSPFLLYTLNYALATVSDDLAGAPSVPGSWNLYQLATFNLAGAVLMEYASDVLYGVAGASWAQGIATLTTAAPHSVIPGDKLTVSGISPNGYNSNAMKLGYAVAQAVPDNTHISYAVGADPGTPVVVTNGSVSEQFFMTARQKFKLNSFVPGAISNASDLSTSAGFVSPDFLKGMTLEQLNLVKTPWGRTYLSIQQKFGLSIWGIT